MIAREAPWNARSASRCREMDETANGDRPRSLIRSGAIRFLRIRIPSVREGGIPRQAVFEEFSSRRAVATRVWVWHATHGPYSARRRLRAAFRLSALGRGPSSSDAPASVGRPSQAMPTSEEGRSISTTGWSRGWSLVGMTTCIGENWSRAFKHRA